MDLLVLILAKRHRSTIPILPTRRLRGRLSTASTERPKPQIARADIWRLMYSAWRRTSATMVSVGFADPGVLRRLPSETKRFLVRGLVAMQRA
jgi:hypothetical protein